MTVFHISKGTSLPLKEVLGGDEARFMTPAIAQNLGVLDSTLSCWFDPESVEQEVPLFNRFLDILAKAEIPGTGEEIPVAIENQYGIADPDHFGRLVGWYMPETSAEMGVLIAEGFEPHLIRAVSEGKIVQPKYGLWLVEASGQMVNGTPTVSYAVRATSVERDVLLAREIAFKKNATTSTGDQSTKVRAETELTERVFAHIAATGSGPLCQKISTERTISRWYRKIEEFEHGSHLSIFIGRNRISIGSVYMKGALDPAVLDQLTNLNATIDLEPQPTKRELRSLWWTIADVGRSTPPEQLGSDLGELLERKFNEIEPTLAQHQEKILQIIRGGSLI